MSGTLTIIESRLNGVEVYYKDVTALDILFHIGKEAVTVSTGNFSTHQMKTNTKNFIINQRINYMTWLRDNNTHLIKKRTKKTMIQGSYRRTGRTFRMLLKALLAASRGQKVCIVTYNMEYAHDLCNRTFSMVENYGNKSEKLKITIGEGSILFIGRKQPVLKNKDFTKSLKIMHDHYIGY